MTKKRHIINNKGGRPRVPAYEKMSIDLHVRISPKLDAIIDINAETANKTRLKYIRETLEKGTVKQIVSPEFIKLLHDLSNLGNNVKDIRDYLRRHGYFPQSEKCDSILEDLGQLLAYGRHLREVAAKEDETETNELKEL